MGTGPYTAGINTPWSHISSCSGAKSLNQSYTTFLVLSHSSLRNMYTRHRSRSRKEWVGHALARSGEFATISYTINQRVPSVRGALHQNPYTVFVYNTSVTICSRTYNMGRFRPKPNFPAIVKGGVRRQAKLRFKTQALASGTCA